MKSVATPEYWGGHWNKTILEIASSVHPVRQWIEREIPDTTSATCLEIGCYPGKFLAVFGEKGYELNGIDFFKGSSAVGGWLKHSGYRMGEIVEADFLEHKTSATYDLVCSFGFIEHFKNWPELLEKHERLLKLEGRIVLDVPNLSSPLYYALYRLLEPETLENHVLKAMDLAALRTYFKERGYRIQFADYIGKFYFRYVTRQDNRSKMIERFINFLAPLFELLPSSVYKRYIGIIVVRR